MSLKLIRYIFNGIKYKEIENERIDLKYILRINQIFIFIYYISIIFCYLISFLYYNIQYYYNFYFIKNKNCQKEIPDKSDNYPSLNLLHYNINPYLEENYEQDYNTSENECPCAYKCEKIIYQKIRLGLKLIFFILSIIAIVYFNICKIKFFLFILFLNCIIILLSLSINFPFCFANKMFCKKGKYKKEINNLPLLISRVINFVIFANALVLFAIFQYLKRNMKMLKIFFQKYKKLIFN